MSRLLLMPLLVSLLCEQNRACAQSFEYPIRAANSLQDPGPAAQPVQPGPQSGAIPGLTTALIRPGLQTAKSLKIVVLEGQDAVNYIPTRTVTPPVVEVRSERELPVEGATVTFELP